MHFASALLTLFLCFEAESAVAQVPAPVLVTGGKLEAELDRELAASWENVPLRTILQRISDQRQVAIVLDRRIDPSREMTVDLAGKPLRAAIQSLAAAAGGEMRVVGNTIFIGPPAATAKLRTLVELRGDELRSSAAEISPKRRLELGRRRTVRWGDLDRPRDILDQIGTLFDLEVLGSEQVPHDLWAGAMLPEASVREALSLVLIQFDLTFAWTGDGRAIRIVPVSDEALLERRYAPRGMTATVAAERWAAAIPGLAAEPAAREVLVRGTAEQHDALADLIQPTRRIRPAQAAASERPTPIERRRFSLEINAVPASKLMDDLEKSGIVFKYDAQALSDAQIDLDTHLRLNIQNATGEEFFRAVFEPLGLAHSIDGMTVTLTPRR